ncbi:MAG TPA: NifB/NifX family molybdenum-iron cluster-binding protein [bacterium]|nr:NifB/NifX family molybdenum-iron cluster-binding protein [bacterium]HPP11520.1 NifB/NifX family molybdenum-iron cluster-binding protein [bacterium]
MKIAVTATGKSLDEQVDQRFGRCRWFLIVDTDSLDYEAVENTSAELGGGAGIQAAQLVSGQEVKYVLTGNCGPNAFRTLQAAGIKVVTGVRGTVRQAVEQFKAGEFSNSSGPNVPGHFGQK